jgi:hypothetical protein
MNEEMTKKMESAICALAGEAEKATLSADALQYATAVRDVSQALVMIKLNLEKK